MEGEPQICCSVLIRCAKQHRGSATVMMRARGWLGDRQKNIDYAIIQFYFDANMQLKYFTALKKG